MHNPSIQIKRIYDAATIDDGYRVLVDRLWPRGIKKSEARIDEWAKDLAPTTALRTAYNHQPEYWEVFQQQYYAELLNNPLTHHFLDKWENEKHLTLLYASKDPRYSHAQVLKNFLDMQYKSR